MSEPALRTVLDTNALSALMRRQPAAMARLRAQKPGDFILVSPVAAEIHYGLQRLPADSRKRELLSAEYEQLRALLRWEDWTEAAALEFGRQKALLAASRALIEDMDIAIGATAIALGAKLATCNVSHLHRLQGLVVEDWNAPSGG